MKSRMQTSKMRHGASSVVLIALVLVAVVMLNVIVAILAQRYEWMYKNMNVPVAYTLSDDYAEYVRETVVPISARLIANKTSYKFLGDEINKITNELKKTCG